MRKLLTFATLFALVHLLSCGGGSSTVAPGGGAPPPGGQPGTELPIPPSNIPELTGNPAPEAIAAQPLPALPGTTPAEPADVEAALQRAASRAQTSGKHTSALLITIPPTNVTTTSPGGGGTSHNYEPKLGLTWHETQDTTVETEYHVYGRVYNLNLLPDGVSYATIGLTTWFNYDYALNQTVPPQSAYMFNQSLYLHMRRVADNTYIPGPNILIRLCDSNGRYHPSEFVVNGAPFDYDLRLAPTNPMLSNPGAPPYSSHQCGLADLMINGVPLPGAMEYGNDNWGWRTAAGPERYDAPSGGVTVLGQAYSSGSAVTSALNFDAQLISGPIASPTPNTWYCQSHDRTRQSASPVNGPQNSGVLWTAPSAVSQVTSSPVIDGAGNVYVAGYDGASNWVYGFQSNGAPLAGWPYLMAAAPGSGGADWGSAAVGLDGTIYAAVGDNNFGAASVFAINPDGSQKWVAGITSYFMYGAILESGNYVYVVPWAIGNIYVLNKNTGAVVSTPPLPNGAGISGVAARADGSRVYCNRQFGVSAYTAGGGVAWHFNLPGGYECFNCPVVVAPDGTIFVGAASSSGPSALFAIQDNGATASLRATFGGTGFVPGGHANCPVAIYDLGGGSYRVVTRSDTGAVNCFNELGVPLWTAPATGISYGAPAFGADGKVYVATHFNDVRCFDSATGGPVWTQNLVGNGILGTPAIADDGTLIVASSNAGLIALSDVAPAGIEIDATNLPAARFLVFDAANTLLTGSLDTDVVFDASSLGFTTGSQFYVRFGTDPAQSPDDQFLYPPRPDGPAGGLVTVNAGSLTIPVSLQPYFDNPVGTRRLRLLPGAYNRIYNDVTALGHSRYEIFDTAAGVPASPPLDADASNVQRGVLRAQLTYHVRLFPEAYPQAGSIGPLGAMETIYPSVFPAGHFTTGFGLLSEGGAVAGPDNDNTDLYDQAGLTNSLQADAYCRFEAEASPTLVSRYGFQDTNLGTWIVIPSFPFGREPLARPFDAFAFARGTAFEASDGVFFSGGVTVNPNHALNASAYPNSETVTIGGGSLDLRPIPTRVHDDPGQADPGQPGSDVTGSGPWTVPLKFLLQYGTGPWFVDLDADFGAAWDDGAPGKVYSTAFSPFPVTGLKNFNQTIPASHGAGTYTFAIRVTDTAGFQYTYVWPTPVTLVAAPPSWHIVSVDSAGNVGEGASLCLVAGNPAISYKDAGNGNLKYARSATSLGGNLADWIAFSIDTLGNVGDFSSLAVISGNPGIAYRGPSGGLRFARSSTVTGGLAGDWLQIVDVDTIAENWNISLKEVNGNPAIAYLGGGLRYARSTSPDGGAPGDWSQKVNIAPAGSFCSLAVVSGNPAIAYFQNAVSDLMYVRATSSTGGIAGDWLQLVTVDTAGNTGLELSLADVNGAPCISYRNSSTNSLMYARSTTSTGSANPDWSLKVLVEGGVASLNTSVASVAGKPAISYGAISFGQVKLASSTTLSGGAAPDWNNQVAAPVSGNWTSLADISGNPAIAFNDLTNANLVYAIFY